MDSESLEMRAVLVLEDGAAFSGVPFGAVEAMRARDGAARWSSPPA